MSLVIDSLHLTAPALVIHGGAGNYVTTHTPEMLIDRGNAIQGALHAAYAVLTAQGARAAVMTALAVLEQDPRFNAGRGSAIQRDGRIACSAAVMDGRRTRMSAVINARNVLHPSRLCDVLLDREPAAGLVPERFLDGEGAEILRAELGLPIEDLDTPRQRKMFENRKHWLESGAQSGNINLEEEHAAIGTAEVGASAETEQQRDADEGDRHGTVGAVALDLDGNLFAGTSTGGRGFEIPGRVSDTPTPAGNYACPQVAISATGIGEFIIDMNLCGRVATRVLDGMPLNKAVMKTLKEADQLDFGLTRDGNKRGSNMGLIAITPDGDAVLAYTTEAMGSAARGAEGETFVDIYSRAPSA